MTGAASPPGSGTTPPGEPDPEAVAGPPPPAAAEIFGARVGLAVRYAELLATEGIEQGLLGPRERPVIWQRHLVNSALLADLIPANARVIDLGSGAGLPGIPLAIARPDIRVTLVEPMQRRCRFLIEAVRRLELAEVTVRRMRADGRTAAGTADVVVARAVAPLHQLIPWALPLLAPPGVLLAMKGERASTEISEARRHGVRLPMDLRTAHVMGHTATVVQVSAQATTPPVGRAEKA